jgi:hypothetical protein
MGSAVASRGRGCRGCRGMEGRRPNRRDPIGTALCAFAASATDGGEVALRAHAMRVRIPQLTWPADQMAFDDAFAAGYREAFTSLALE